MEPEIVAELSLHNNLVLKRKRTQRQRPLSSSDDALTMTTSSSTPLELISSSEEEEEEDQEVAKCLILLAQGIDEYQTECNSSPPVEIPIGRKMDGSGLYECKTCNRFFHSFQALGGHRTSHKKLKVTKTDNELELRKSTPDNSSCRNLIPQIPVSTLQLGNNVRATGNIRNHRCLICYAEFPSGQALGGHMRKHRVNATVTHTFTTESTTTKAEDGLIVTQSLTSPDNEEAGIEPNGSNDEFQCLDLNLPASASSSEDYEISVAKFSLSSKQHQQSQTLQDSGLVLSGPALVDCHY